MQILTPLKNVCHFINTSVFLNFYTLLSLIFYSVITIHFIPIAKPTCKITDTIQLNFRHEPVIKDDEIKSLVNSREKFISYLVNHLIHYHPIANPGRGK